MPRERPVAEALPLLLGHLGLKIYLRNAAGLAGSAVQTQIQRDAKRCFRRAHEPAREDVFLRSARCAGLHEINVMRANPDVRRLILLSCCATRSWQPQSSASTTFSEIVRAREKFLQPVRRATSRLGGRRNTSSLAPNAAIRPRESTSNLLAEAIRFLDVVRHHQRRSAVSSECFLELRFHLASQMRIERRKRLIEQQRFRFNCQRSRQCRALLFAA